MQGLSQRGGRERGQGPPGSQNTGAMGAFTCGTKRETEARSGGRQGADPREAGYKTETPNSPHPRGAVLQYSRGRGLRHLLGGGRGDSGKTGLPALRREERGGYSPCWAGSAPPASPQHSPEWICPPAARRTPSAAARPRGRPRPHAGPRAPGPQSCLSSGGQSAWRRGSPRGSGEEKGLRYHKGVLLKNFTCCPKKDHSKLPPGTGTTRERPQEPEGSGPAVSTLRP